MTGFDVFALLVILGSAAAGWVRGGTREIITLFSFVVAAFLALVTLPLTAKLGRALVDPDWAGSISAAIVAFIVIYFGMRLFGQVLSKRAQAHPRLGGVDRIIGIFVGAGRSLLLLGAIHLVVVAAMPGDKTPTWLRDATVRPVTAAAARAIQFILPGIGRGADALTPVVTSSVSKGFSDEEALPPTQSEPTSPRAAP